MESAVAALHPDLVTVKGRTYGNNKGPLPPERAQLPALQTHE